MLTNKWIQFGLSVAMALSAGAASLDWSSVLTPSHAAGVAAGIATAKALLNLAAPGPGAIVSPTGGAVVTHKTV